MGKAYYLSINGEPGRGPLTHSAIRDAVESGVVPRDALVCEVGATEWHPIAILYNESPTDIAGRVPAPAQRRPQAARGLPALPPAPRPLGHSHPGSPEPADAPIVDHVSATGEAAPREPASVEGVLGRAARLLLGMVLRTGSLLCYAAGLLIVLLNKTSFPVVFFGLAVLAIGAALARFGRRLSQDLALDLMADPRSPVVLLRSFKRDEHAIRRRLTVSEFLVLHPNYFKSRESLSFEEELVKRLKRVGPVVAIGRPGEVVQPAGASRLYVPDGESWQDAVVTMMREASLVVMIVDDTAGTCWELAEAMSTSVSRKLLLVPAPPSAGTTRPPSYYSEWDAIRSRVSVLPEINDRVAYVWLGEDDGPLVVEALSADPWKQIEALDAWLKEGRVAARRASASSIRRRVGGDAGVVAANEWVMFFESPAPYFLASAFTLAVGLCVFVVPLGTSFWQAEVASMSRLFESVAWVLGAVVVPLMTVRAFVGKLESETVPQLNAAVFVRYFAALWYILLIIATTLLYPVALFGFPWHLGALDWYQMWAGYVGLALLAAAHLSIGLLCSSVTRSQGAAFALTSVTLIFFHLLGGATIPRESGAFGDAVGFLSFELRCRAFWRGIIDTRAVVYFLSVVVLGPSIALHILARRIDTRSS